MKKRPLKLLLILLAVSFAVFPVLTAFATEEVPQEITQMPVEEQTEQIEEPQQQEDVSGQENSGVEGFVTRMYKVCLDREPDAQGLQEWRDALLSGKSTGADIAYGFIFSPEFISKKLSNTDYLKALYQAFFGREADSEGIAAWNKVLEEGYSRLFLLAGFVNSIEFGELCKSYGITRGELKLSSTDLNPSIAVFVERLYKLCLLREADAAGLETWTNALNSKKITGAEVAYGFVFSPEFVKRNVNDVEYVKIMYRAFFNREADLEGLSGWLNAMMKGTLRQNVLAGFTNSEEFSELCKKYNVERGTLPTVSNPQPTPTPTLVLTRDPNEPAFDDADNDNPFVPPPPPPDSW